MYKSRVMEIGHDALSFDEENIIILFGPKAPKELKDVAIIHHELENSDEYPIKKGGKLVIDNQVYEITALGSVANKNLQELGHVSVYFTDSNEGVLPGSIYVKPNIFPKIKTDSLIMFE
ncbi:PTS glucitol/sorbitol transporter subunit IIA [Sporolactobacillus sp. KGMB 08714]|uniref:PTS glucitol/sorbitol transporter subunit IIA n=1 Tax=Sporolactobacillus sp. KGMB 08714 TaxID=3064704 RepID=UPI002FBDF535